MFQENCEDTKGVIRSHKSKKDNGKRKRTKRQTMIYKKLHINLKIEQHETNKKQQKTEVNSGALEGKHFLLH